MTAFAVTYLAMIAVGVLVARAVRANRAMRRWLDKTHAEHLADLAKRGKPPDGRGYETALLIGLWPVFLAVLVGRAAWWLLARLGRGIHWAAGGPSSGQNQRVT